MLDSIFKVWPIRPDFVKNLRNHLLQALFKTLQIVTAKRWAPELENLGLDLSFAAWVGFLSEPLGNGNNNE